VIESKIRDPRSYAIESRIQDPRSKIKIVVLVIAVKALTQGYAEAAFYRQRRKGPQRSATIERNKQVPKGGKKISYKNAENTESVYF